MSCETTYTNSTKSFQSSKLQFRSTSNLNPKPQRFVPKQHINSNFKETRNVMLIQKFKLQNSSYKFAISLKLFSNITHNLMVTLKVKIIKNKHNPIQTNTMKEFITATIPTIIYLQILVKCMIWMFKVFPKKRSLYTTMLQHKLFTNQIPEYK